MKRILTILIMLVCTLMIWAQSISVSSFRLLENDLDANTAGTMEKDQNGEVAALIKVVTTQTGFTFDSGTLGIVKCFQTPGEVWVYVPHGAKKISIKHAQLGMQIDYDIPCPIEAARTYEMVLETRSVGQALKGNFRNRQPTNIVHSSLTNVDDRRVVTVGNISFTMIRVDGGSFIMGATNEQSNDIIDKKNIRHVNLLSFYIGETEVTQSLWKAVMGSNPSYFKGNDYPVDMVNWDDCQRFIKKLNKETEKMGLIFRLPTEAEWEFAARGGNKSKGYKYSGSNNLKDIAWFYANHGNSTHEVKTKQANELGLYDMSGNVWEWVQNDKGDPTSAQTKSTGLSSNLFHVSRGGGWITYASECRLSNRNIILGTIRDSAQGFRLACSFIPQ